MYVNSYDHTHIQTCTHIYTYKQCQKSFKTLIFRHIALVVPLPHRVKLVYIHMCTHTCTCIYMHICRERERKQRGNAPHFSFPVVMYCRCFLDQIVSFFSKLNFFKLILQWYLSFLAYLFAASGASLFLYISSTREHHHICRSIFLHLRLYISGQPPV